MVNIFENFKQMFIISLCEMGYQDAYTELINYFQDILHFFPSLIVVWGKQALQIDSGISNFFIDFFITYYFYCNTKQVIF